MDDLVISLLDLPHEIIGIIVGLTRDNTIVNMCRLCRGSNALQSSITFWRMALMKKTHEECDYVIVKLAIARLDTATMFLLSNAPLLDFKINLATLYDCYLCSVYHCNREWSDRVNGIAIEYSQPVDVTNLFRGDKSVHLFVDFIRSFAREKNDDVLLYKFSMMTTRFLTSRFVALIVEQEITLKVLCRLPSLERRMLQISSPDNIIIIIIRYFAVKGYLVAIRLIMGVKTMTRHAKMYIYYYLSQDNRALIFDESDMSTYAYLSNEKSSLPLDVLQDLHNNHAYKRDIYLREENIKIRNKDSNEDLDESSRSESPIPYPLITSFNHLLPSHRYVNSS